MLYFAYGSNMSTARLVARAPSARLRGTATLRGYVLRFHKRGKDGTAKCDAFGTDGREDVVLGVLFDISDEADWAALDRAERGYRRDDVEVECGGELERAATYRALPDWIDANLLPSAKYRAYVAGGAREHGLPADYIANIEGHRIEGDAPRRSSSEST